MKFSKRTLGMKALPKCIETLQRDRAMPKDTGELIFQKSINIIVSLFFVISRVLLLHHMPPFCRACHKCDRLCENVTFGGENENLVFKKT